MADLIRFSEYLIQDGYTYTYGVCTADLTGGGSPDLVLTDINGGIDLFENDGRGGFTRHEIHRRGCEWLERHVALDIDGDGRAEIVSVDNINGCLVCFEYDGDPRDAASWRDYYISEGELPGAYDVAAADLDGDGEIEIAASGWCIGNDICCFKRRSGIWDRHIIDSDMAEARAVCFADFNKNGKLDLLATACNDNQVVWYENREGLSWRKHIIDESPRPYHGHPADMNGDGVVDVVMALAGEQSTNEGSIVWYENKDACRGTWEKHFIGTLAGAFEAVAGDIDGDGQLEVVATSHGEGQLALFKHEGDPRGPWQMQLLKENWDRISQPVLADLDGDGRLDLAVCSAGRGQGVRWWKNEGPY